MFTPEQLDSGRFRVQVWNPLTRKKETVRNPKPGSRGSWASWMDAANAAREREETIGVQTALTEADEGEPRRRQQITFSRYAHTWLAGLEGSQNTIRNRRSAVRVLVARFGADTPVDAITETDVRAWLAETRQQLGLRTRWERLRVLQWIMAQAVRDGLRTDNPAEVKLPQPPKNQPGAIRYFSEDELACFLAACTEWFRPAVLIAHDCGLRASEVAGLRWLRLDLDSDEPQVLVADVIDLDRSLRNHTKNGVSAAIPLTARVVEALRVLRSQRQDKRTDFVIRSSVDRPISGKLLRDRFRDARAGAGFTDDPVPTFHHLRHMCANNLARAGASAPTIQAILRHASLEVSQRYIDRLELGAMRAAMNDVAHMRTGVVSLASRDQHAS